MNKFPTTIFDLNGQPALVKRAYSGNISVWECNVARLGSATTYMPRQQRIGKFADLAALSRALIERFKGSATQASPVTERTKLRRVVWTAPAATNEQNVAFLRVALAQQADWAGFDVDTVDVEAAQPGQATGVVAFRGASQDVPATIEMCRLVGKLLKAGSVQ